MKTLQKAVDIGKKVGEWILIVISMIAFFVMIFLAGGGPAIFYTPDTVCNGERWVTVADNDDVAKLADMYFHDEGLDRHTVIESIKNLNGTQVFTNTNNAKIPMECRREKSP